MLVDTGDREGEKSSLTGRVDRQTNGERWRVTRLERRNGGKPLGNDDAQSEPLLR